MADEPMDDPTAAAESTASEDAAGQPVAAEPPVDWEDILNKAPDEVLAKHRRVQGIAGSHAERLFQRRAQDTEHERQQTAASAAREELKRLAQEKPLEFADMFLSHEDAEQARQRVLDMERVTAKNMMEQIGAAYHGLPEWQNLTDTEKAQLREAVSDAPDNDVLPRFNAAALNIVADRRANTRLTDRLPAEKEAWRKEWEAERLGSEQGPDLRRPSDAPRRRLNWAAMDDKDFNSWWKQKYG